MKDLTMADLAERAGELRFDDSEIAHSQFDELKSLRISYRNCRQSLYFRWEIRLHLAGAKRMLGWFNLVNDYYATRFADLCIVRFWKYRRIGRKQITDSDLNYSVTLAEKTLSEHKSASRLLDEIELWLQQNYQLAPPRQKRIVDAPATPG